MRLGDLRRVSLKRRAFVGDNDRTEILWTPGGKKGTGAYIDEYGWLWQDFDYATYRRSRARRDAVSSAESGRCANGDFSRDSRRHMT